MSLKIEQTEQEIKVSFIAREHLLYFNGENISNSIHTVRLIYVNKKVKSVAE